MFLFNLEVGSKKTQALFWRNPGWLLILCGVLQYFHLLKKTQSGSSTTSNNYMAHSMGLYTLLMNHESEVQSNRLSRTDRCWSWLAAEGFSSLASYPKINRQPLACSRESGDRATYLSDPVGSCQRGLNSTCFILFLWFSTPSRWEDYCSILCLEWSNKNQDQGLVTSWFRQN